MDLISKCTDAIFLASRTQQKLTTALLLLLVALQSAAQSMCGHGKPISVIAEQSVFRADSPSAGPCPSSKAFVSLPVDNPTKSFWLDTPGANPLAEEGSKGALTPDADICIIGSGITGVSAAWHLTQSLKSHAEKMSVVVFEAREFCSGATGRNGGHLVPNAFHSFRAREARYTTNEARKSSVIEKYTADELVKFIKDRNLEDVVELREGDHVTLFRTDDEEIEARKDFEGASAAGLDLGVVRWFDNQELVENYNLSTKLNYTGVWTGAHNLWPCKLVTELYNDALSFSSSSNVTLALHTKTPITHISHAIFSRRRKWELHTPRGKTSCTYVLHATNAYAGHLLPSFAGPPELQESSITLGGGHGGHEEPPPSSPHPPAPHPQPPSFPPSPFQITPTRGQVGAIRASVPAEDLLWRNGWDGGGGGWEYWFPRFQDILNETNDSPLIILGGGREFSGGKLEAGVTDDSLLNPRVSEALKKFLPGYFPNLFAGGKEETEKTWKMEWTGIMGFTKIGDPFVGPVYPPEIFDSAESLWNLTKENPYDGQFIAAGYTGHGMVRAYACAEAVANMIVGRVVGKPPMIPEWLPLRYLTWVAR